MGDTKKQDKDAQNDPIYLENKRFTNYLFRYYISLRNAIIKIKDNVSELDTDEYEVLEPIYDKFLEAENRRDNGD
jgi:hypothetical protein